MSKNYGTMMGYDDAIRWIEALDVPEGEAERKKRVLARMQYERDQNIPVKPNEYKGKRPTLSYYMCGRCGTTVDVNYKYCWKCGFAIDWQALEKERAERTQKARNT